jgi:hypothetical protein
LIDSRLPVLYSVEASIISLLAVASQLLLSSQLSINQLPPDIGADGTGTSQQAKQWKQKQWYNDCPKESSSLARAALVRMILECKIQSVHVVYGFLGLQRLK